MEPFGLSALIDPHCTLPASGCWQYESRVPLVHYNEEEQEQEQEQEEDEDEDEEEEEDFIAIIIVIFH